MKISEDLRGQRPHIENATRFQPRAQAGPGAGWKVTIPGGRPLATPAVAKGRLFLGGGFGSYDFFAFDAVTGAVVWHYQTEDDGPTAAVVADDYVAFNTESCELEVLSIEGKRIWKKWLGDPLLSMPAINDGRIFMAFPDSQGDHRHYLASFQLSDGREQWRQPIAGEIITCPVLADGQVFVTNLDGTLSSFRQDNGQPLWHEAKNATSAAAVWREQCYFSQRKEQATPFGSSAPVQTEHLASKYAAAPSQEIPGTARSADYLDTEKRRRRSPHYAKYARYDTAVGFGSHKGDAKIEHALRNLGTDHVSAIWAYQGSKPFISKERMYSGLGDTVHCVDPHTQDVLWKKKLREAPEEELLDGFLTPPAVVNGKLFLGTIDGRALCLSAATGEELWSAQLGEPVIFQPAVAHGRAYFTTGAGSLFCLETGDAADDGWLMWGATPAHNGQVD
jgi:outer membrane protein assembly factor BamB